MDAICGFLGEAAITMEKARYNKSWEEFELHARAGLARELSDTDLKEMLMLVAIYAGVPVANTAFAQARKLIEEADR